MLSGAKAYGQEPTSQNLTGILIIIGILTFLHLIEM